MLVPLDIALAAILICAGLGFFAGLCIGSAWQPEPDPTFRAELIAYASMVDEMEAPRLATWTPELRQRFRYQQEASRQLVAMRKISGRIA